MVRDQGQGKGKGREKNLALTLALALAPGAPYTLVNFPPRPMPRPKIAILYVGGSIGMVMNQKSGRIEAMESMSVIYKAMPEMQKEVSMEFFSIANVGSSEVTAGHWVEIAEKIEDLYDHFEGFVVIHGTNTMTYTACALSFALQNLRKPVILTGALLPINDIAGDGRMNLIFAIRAAQLDIAEVCVVLGPKVLRGTRAKKVDESLLQTFDSPRFPPLADFSTEVRLHPWRMVRRKRTLECRPTFDPNVLVITLTPSMPQAYLDAVLQSKPHGIVMRAYGPGMLSEHLFPWLREVKRAGIPVVITSQSLRGAIDLHRYRKQLTLEELGIISGKNMSFECAFVKLMWALPHAKTPLRLRELMERSLVGELDE
ncbi:MAG: L-asparaginase type I family protein [Candidatus Peregrinibacteria bacterium Greene0416_19]|nr:MAG: L-asparaginase type I family protein [Candidatus Peregrinibacteria bacterium Greene0416_19]